MKNDSISTVTAQALSCPEAQTLFNDLKSDGYKTHVNKKEYAEIVGCFVSAIDNYISKGYGVPNYKKIGAAKNARVLFSLRDVAEYLTTQTIQTA